MHGNINGLAINFLCIQVRSCIKLFLKEADDFLQAWLNQAGPVYKPGRAC
jgi:hypothetical protein